MLASMFLFCFSAARAQQPQQRAEYPTTDDEPAYLLRPLRGSRIGKRTTVDALPEILYKNCAESDSRRGKSIFRAG